jgi:hypothetical protein
MNSLHHCITCSSPLLSGQIKNGSRRCKVCIKASPGRLYTTGWHTSNKRDHPNNWWTEKPHKPTPPSNSWWTEKPQAGFTAEADLQLMRDSRLNYKSKRILLAQIKP